VYGRTIERATLTALLDRARSSRSGVIVIGGAPGIGKSALLEDTVAAAEGMRVLRAVGAESESSLAFAGLHQLLRPLVRLIDEIPEPQGVALRTALGVMPGPAPDPFLVGAGFLSVLAMAAEEQPLLCVVEDAHWIDSPSLGALTFAARRLQAEPIAVVLAAREGEACELDASGLPELRLGGLDPDAARALLDARVSVPLSDVVRERLFETAEGNPLAILELPLALTEAQRAGVDPLAAPLPLTERLEDAFRRRADPLSPGCRLLLLVAAADNTGDAAVVVRAARALGVQEDELETTEIRDLLRLADGRVEFRHPLVRSAVFQSAPFLTRQSVHRALADVLEAARDADRRAWHLAAAATGADEQVAQELERSAERAKSRGGHSSAAAVLARSASLTPDDEQKARRQLAAAQSAWQAGQHRVACALVEQARELATEPVLRTEIEHLRGTIEFATGSPAAAYVIFSSAAAADGVEPERVVPLLLAAMLAAGWAGDLHAQVEVGKRAEQFLDRIGTSFELCALVGLGRLWGGDGVGGRTFLELAMREAEASNNDRRFLWAALCAFHVGDEAAARAFASRDAALARLDGAVGNLVSALSRLALAEIAEGRLASARANAAEGLSLAVGAGLESDACYLRGLLAWASGLLGRTEEAVRFADEALEFARGRDRAWPRAIATVAIGELELASGRAAQAIARFETLTAPGLPPYVSRRAAPSLVEAAVRSGRQELARDAMASFEHWVESTRSRSNRPLVERCRGLLAEGPAARDHFEEALRLHGATENPFERARTELAFGEHLRRAGLRLKAREHLRLASELFVQLGATGWADQADAELRASGAKARVRSTAARDELTPQELQVACFVATGLTNKEVAGQLFLSPRTVDAHLRSIFRKLGITSRAELAGLRLGDGTELSKGPSAVSP
jgi:DNA-binding CsgD family transcriptional regulator